MSVKVQDLLVYQKVCDLHLEICALTRTWPIAEKYELASQDGAPTVRRLSLPKNTVTATSDVASRVSTESRDETAETIHHLYIAFRKRYLSANLSLTAARPPRAP
jgi:hypothetical protein